MSSLAINALHIGRRGEKLYGQAQVGNPSSGFPCQYKVSTTCEGENSRGGLSADMKERVSFTNAVVNTVKIHVVIAA